VIQPKKRLGQHFLHNPRVIARIIAAIAPRPGQHVVEIGPGTGALTRPLLRALSELDVVEFDRDLAPRLTEELGMLGTLRVHLADALEFDFRSLRPDHEKIRLVGNLPYNISTPLLFHLLAQANCVEDMVFMLQKEVSDRIAARPGGGDYGRLTVMIQSRCGVEVLFHVEPGAFYPPPQVRSSVLRLIPRPPPLPIGDDRLFEDVVKQAFSKRRKTLRNALKGMVTDEQFRETGIDPGLRPETLAVEDFIRLANAVAGKRD
jgi:16S rRNA (adenine1518-N6/adenine1519-N6)-dimethyltransferase